MPIEPKAGEVWFAELGMAEKSRPVLVLAVPGDADARSLVIVAPLTSQIRGMRDEVNLGKPRWLSKPSAVNVQGLASFDRHKLSRHMGTLTKAEMGLVKEALRICSTCEFAAFLALHVSWRRYMPLLRSLYL